MANIRNHCSWVHSDDWDAATKKSIDLVKAAVAKARLVEPLTEEEFSIYPATLVIGGGVSGMKAALALADMGVKTILIEKDKKLGGRLKDLHTMFPSDTKSKDIINPLIKEVNKNKSIKVITDAELVDVSGFIGNYEGKIKQKGKTSKLKFGTIIVATGFKEIDLDGEYQYGKNSNIISQTELEKKIKSNSFKKRPRNIVIVNCAGAMDEKRPYCCRIGCGVSIKNAKLIAQKYPGAKIHLLYRDMRVFGKEEEEYYANVLKDYHVTTVRYSGEKKPKVILDKKDPENGPIKVKVYDDILNEELEIPADLVVLTINTEGEILTESLKNMLKIPADAGGFFMEAHAKIRPLDFATDGIYVCGAAHYPKNLVDSIAQAEGAASRAAIPIMQKKMKGEGAVSEVQEDMCSGCSTCVTICPYSAIEVKPCQDDKTKKVAYINKALCKGCGACASACPSGAIDQKGFKREQIGMMLVALLEDCK
jgi:heterodisulfide reductase subunit A